ncbi:MAG TPA: hypothetical protein PLE10_07670 [Brevefilum sp.]|nr:hypothetical protein [Brevefilum sp.]HOR19684.1 hypothetical protein [Brevefilum sp.]HPL69511.1 hypothetical protein [Brevefilum sp.]
MEIFSFVADIIGIFSAFAAVAAWVNTKRIQKNHKLELERLNQKIKIRLINQETSNYIDLNGEMRREEISRAEILGWIGMLPMILEKERSRYKLEFTNTDEFFTRMNEIRAGSGDMIFEIDCNKGELDQFAVEKKNMSNH